MHYFWMMTQKLSNEHDYCQTVSFNDAAKVPQRVETRILIRLLKQNLITKSVLPLLLLFYFCFLRRSSTEGTEARKNCISPIEVSLRSDG